MKLPATEEVHPLSSDLDLFSIRKIVEQLHREDARALRAVRLALPHVSQAASRAAEALSKGGRLIYVGAGTSGRLAALDAAECPPTFGVPRDWVQAIVAGGRRALWRAVEGAEDDLQAGAKAIAAARVEMRDLVVGISASSTTPFVLGALSEARRRRAGTVLVTSQRPGPKGFQPGILIWLQTGAELLAGSTRLKAGTATKLVLNALSTAALVKLGKVHRGRMVDLKASNLKLKARALRMVQELAHVSAQKAAALLLSADGHPRLALVMHWSGLSAKGARRRLGSLRLRDLEAASAQRRR